MYKYCIVSEVVKIYEWEKFQQNAVKFLYFPLIVKILFYAEEHNIVCFSMYLIFWMLTVFGSYVITLNIKI